MSDIKLGFDEYCAEVREYTDAFAEREPELLIRAKNYLAQILFKECDVLVIDEIGKNISGTGMDPNVVKRFTNPRIQEDPICQNIVVLDLTKEAHGNGNGMGLADFSTRRLFDKVDMKGSYANPLTSRITPGSKIPLIMDNDRQAIRAAVKCCFDIDPNKARIIHIHNTLCMGEFYISENLIPEAVAHPNILHTLMQATVLMKFQNMLSMVLTVLKFSIQALMKNNRQILKRLHQNTKYL